MDTIKCFWTWWKALDTMEYFWTQWKVSINFDNFWALLESFWTLLKDSGPSGKILDTKKVPGGSGKFLNLPKNLLDTVLDTMKRFGTI